MPEFKLGHGSKVDIGRIAANSTITWTEIIGSQDVNLPNSTSDDIETTHMGSNFQREFISGLTDNGEVSLEMNWEPGSATDLALKAIKASRENIQLRFRIAPLAQANTFALTETYVAYCKGYERVAPVADKLTATVNFRISGSVTGV